MEFLIGIFVGGLLFWLFTDHKKPSGAFIIDFRDPDTNPFRLEWFEDLNDIYSKKRIWLNVVTYEEDSPN